IYVHVITDNKNRTLTSVKTTISKCGGNLGEAGTVGWMFEKKGMILAKAVGKSADEAEMEAIDAGAEDIDRDGDEFEILTAPNSLMKVRENLEKAGFVIEKAEFDFVAKNPVKIGSLEDARKVIHLVEELEDDDDVANVYGNFDIPEEFLG
ncbi:MAG: YebC/PmpR family DNA-binding transcriptional regulator, partial [Candidatus Peregrinibacteria bacterium]